MTTSLRISVAPVVMVLAIAALAAPAAAQGPLAEARALYAAAAYEDALSALAKLDSTTPDRGEADQYRAFCLIALGRTGDAERAIESVVAADPLFVPRSDDVAPRILTMFSDVRRRLLPEIARRAYLDGRGAFQAKEFAAAAKQFDQAMRVLDQAGTEGIPGMDDLRILVAGFVDLARAATERPTRAVNRPEPAAVREPAPAPAPPLNAYSAPVAIHQELPPWNPLTPAIGDRTYAGSVRVVIGADGRVQEATLVKSVHPLYDPHLLQAAREWEYEPALRLGEPIVSEKVVEIRLTPR